MDSKEEFLTELIGSAIGIETLADDQQRDTRYHEGNHAQRMDARMEILKHEAERMADIVHDYGEAENEPEPP